MTYFVPPLVYIVRNGKTVPPEEQPVAVEQNDPLESVIINMFSLLGIEPSVHMENTPKRFAAQLRELTTPEPFNFTTFPATSDEMVTLGPIPFYTLCAHHGIPFYGKAYVGYVPDGLIAGLSKFGRLIKNMAKGFWVQEELTGAIADGIELNLKPRGTAVILEGEHLCMSMRGVQMPGVVTTTSSMRGVFSDHGRTAKAEFLQIIAPRRKTNG